MVTVDRTSLDSFLPPHQLERMEPQLQAAWNTLWKGTGAGSDFLGWRDLPVDYDRAEFQRIQAAAKRIQEELQEAGYHSGILLPVHKDWNDDLVQGQTMAGPAMTMGQSM